MPRRLPNHATSLLKAWWAAEIQYAQAKRGTDRADKIFDDLMNKKESLDDLLVREARNAPTD